MNQIAEGKSPGLDGFTTNFFHFFWDMIKDEVLEIVEESRCKRGVLKAFNATFLSLIPKGEGVDTPSKFKHIALCNVIYKIITKVVVELDKYQVFLFNTYIIAQHNISRILAVSISTLPTKYLESPLFDSTLKHSSWRDLLENLDLKITS